MSKIKQKKTLQTYFSQVRSPYLMTLLCCLLVNITLLAQGETISGTVTDESGSPLPGANVLQRGTSNGVVTDFDGNYAITLSSDGDRALIFSYVGFVAKQLSVGTNQTLNVSLQEDSAVLDEVVVIGYGAVNRKNILGSVASVKADEVVQVTPVNTFDAVQGRLAGVQIQSNGGPGAGFDIRIRGTSTFSAGGNEPLYVVDGQQLENIDNLDPNDIASLEVLKDGATAAIYGSKAANGVVLIKTKSGRSGDVKLEITHASAIGELNSAIPLANTAERILYEDIRRNNTTNLTGVQRDSLSLLNRNSFDLQELLTRASTRNQVNIALSGGGEKSTFYWNSGFLNEEGVVTNSSYKRINSLLKVDTQLSEKLKFGTRMNISYEEQLGLNESEVFRQMVERIAYFPVFEPNGTFTPEIAGRQNPIAEAFERTLKNRNYRAQLFNYGEWQIIPSLSFKSTLGINFRYRKRNEFNPIIVQNPRNRVPTGRERRNLTYDIQQENFFNYKKSFGDHNILGFGGIQIQKFYLEQLNIGANFISDNIETFNNIDPTTLQVDPDGSDRNERNKTKNERNNLFSLFAGFNYDYASKYLIGGTVRRDGSSRFGDNNEYGTFLSGSLGWRISSENFMQGLSGTINNLMLRASYGQTGNERIGAYESLFLYEPGFSYGGSSGVRPVQLSNPDISWESTSSVNLGMDLSMFENRLNLTVDVWKKDTDDLLARVPTPEEIGFGFVRKNVGAVENKGFDITFSGSPLKTANFEWFSSLNLSYLENQVTRLDGGKSFQDGDFLIEEGQKIGNIFGYNNLGIYQFDESNAYANNGERLTPVLGSDGLPVTDQYTLNGQPYTGPVNQITVGGRTPQGGDIIWEDVDGNFSIDQDDRKVIGNGLADWFGGFFNQVTYKQISMSFLFDFTFGNDIFRRYDQERNDLNSSNETPGPDRILGAWLEPGDVTVYPRLSRVPQNRLRPNSFFVEPGDYIKLRYVRFDYTLPKDLMDRINWIDALSFNVSFNNFLTWTNYQGYNPELGSRGNPLQPGVDNLRYPNRNEIIFGAKIQL